MYERKTKLNVGRFLLTTPISHPPTNGKNAAAAAARQKPSSASSAQFLYVNQNPRVTVTPRERYSALRRFLRYCTRLQIFNGDDDDEGDVYSL